MLGFRRSQWFRSLRRTWFLHDIVRPIYNRRLLLDWWRAGRPNPPPHEVKLWAILYLADSVGAVNLVETGSYLGDTIRALRGRFRRLISIEIAPALAEPLQREFSADATVEVVLGDSGRELTRIVATLEGPTVFWLDAHYSGGPTLGGDYVPIFAEIDTISSSMVGSHAILIDDMKDFDGQNGYPTEAQLASHLRERGYVLMSFDNMLHARRT